MKKSVLFVVLSVALVACSNMIKNENGSENLMRLETVSDECKFLYKMDTTAAIYNFEDAQRYTENQIVTVGRGGNAYMINSVDKRQNQGAVFGPEYSYVLNVSVYDCPAK